MNASQQAYADQITAAGNSYKAGSIATLAVIVEAIAESGLGEAMGWDSQNPTYGGLLAGNIHTFGSLGSASSAAVTTAEIHAAFNGGQGYVAGGAIGLARSQSDPLQIAMTNSGSGTQFLSETGHETWAAEAQAIIAAGGGATIKGGIAGHGGTGTLTNASASTTYPFQIGSTSNPDEDLWTGCNRIAQEVNWYFFTNGEVLYYMDGQEMIAQEPAFYLDRINDGGRFASPVGGTYDNTAYGYVSTHKRKFRIQRKAKLTLITSPTQVTLDLICGIDEIRGGDVGVLTSFGLIDGRWLVANCTRSVFGVSSRITLVPPIAPITEAAVAGTTGTKRAALATGTQAPGSPTGSSGNLVSPFSKKYTATVANSDMGVDFGRQQGIATGDPILAIGDCYLRGLTTFYQGQPGMWFELVDKSAGYWGWYVAEEINPKLGASSALIKAGVVVATYATSGTGIEIGWAASVGVTATQAFQPGEVATRHSGNGTTAGRAFLAFLQKVGAV